MKKLLIIISVYFVLLLLCKSSDSPTTPNPEDTLTFDTLLSGYLGAVEYGSSNNLYYNENCEKINRCCKQFRIYLESLTTETELVECKGIIYAWNFDSVYTWETIGCHADWEVDSIFIYDLPLVCIDKIWYRIKVKY